MTGARLNFNLKHGYIVPGKDDAKCRTSAMHLHDVHGQTVRLHIVPRKLIFSINFFSNVQKIFCFIVSRTKGDALSGPKFSSYFSSRTWMRIQSHSRTTIRFTSAYFTTALHVGERYCRHVCQVRFF